MQNDDDNIVDLQHHQVKRSVAKALEQAEDCEQEILGAFPSTLAEAIERIDSLEGELIEMATDNQHLSDRLTFAQRFARDQVRHRDEIAQSILSELSSLAEEGLSQPSVIDLLQWIEEIARKISPRER